MADLMDWLFDRIIISTCFYAHLTNLVSTNFVLIVITLRKNHAFVKWNDHITVN